MHNGEDEVVEDEVVEVVTTATPVARLRRVVPTVVQGVAVVDAEVVVHHGHPSFLIGTSPRNLMVGAAGMVILCCYGKRDLALYVFIACTWWMTPAYIYAAVKQWFRRA